MKMSLNDMKEKIIKEATITVDDLNSKIQAKMDQLAGLVSEEGACHIIANELGVKMMAQSGGRMQIKNILPGMKNFEVLLKVRTKWEPRTFSKGDKEGRVGSCFVGDETGLGRLVFWNDLVDKMDSFKEGDVLLVKDGYVKDNQGRKEVHMNDSSVLIVNPEGETVTLPERQPATRKKIKELTQDEFNIELLGTIVQVFEPRFYEVCPQCSKRTRPQDGDRYVCEEHGEIKPAFSYVLNAVIDDGSDSMRIVCFREQADKLLSKTPEQMLLFKDNVSEFELTKQELLGTIVKLMGRVKKNSMFDRMEFTCQEVFVKPDPEEELKKLQ